MTLEIALMIVGFLIVIVGIVSGITSIWLVVKYFRFNRKENSLGLTGIQIARKILEDNGLEHIKVMNTRIVKPVYIIRKAKSISVSDIIKKRIIL